MAKSEKTVTLPELGEGQEYVAMPVSPGNDYAAVWRKRDIAIYVDGSGRVKKDYAFNAATLSPRLGSAAERQGLVRFVATATTSVKEGESDIDACDRRFAAIIDDSYQPGAGGGARLSTYDKMMPVYMIGYVKTRGGGTKAKATTFYETFKTDERSVEETASACFRALCDANAASYVNDDGTPQTDDDGNLLVTGEMLFTKHWQGHHDKVKAAADLQDKQDKALRQYDTGDMGA